MKVKNLLFNQSLVLCRYVPRSTLWYLTGHEYHGLLLVVLGYLVVFSEAFGIRIELGVMASILLRPGTLPGFQLEGLLVSILVPCRYISWSVYFIGRRGLSWAKFYSYTDSPLVSRRVHLWKWRETTWAPRFLPQHAVAETTKDSKCSVTYVIMTSNECQPLEGRPWIRNNAKPL